MCFIKSPSTPQLVATPAEVEVVQRHQADASATKTSRDENAQGYKQNLKTSPLGIVDEETQAQTQKKTLLGD